MLPFYYFHCILKSLVRAETARVFGNLSRRVEIRQCFHDDGEFSEILEDLDITTNIRYKYHNIWLLNLLSI